jgi:cell division protein FtsZ
MGLHEVSEASALIQESVSPNANVIFGFSSDDSLGDEIRVTVIAAGFDGGAPVRRPAMPISTKTSTDQIQVVEIPEVEEPGFATDTEFRLTSVTEEETYGGYLAPKTEVSTATEAIELPLAPTSGAEGNFGDELDIPDFLK